ncbi:MAG TPA: hypothetical protein VGZ25_08520 [Gemmataceae bacterium]|nr:hypothetical protein [Gemmataceae bacterium]
MTNYWKAALLLMSGCVAPNCAKLLPPEGATQPTIVADVNESLAAARKEARKPLDETEKAPLQGYCTKGFLREGRPVVGKDGDLIIPRPNQSLFVGMPSILYPIFFPLYGTGQYGPESVSDRYVLHLLERGYHWADDGSAGRATVAKNP